MRRSICYCEPHVALAGEEKTWKFIYTTSVALPKGARLKFDLMTKGRDTDWEIPESGPKVKSNAIYALLEDETLLHAKEVNIPQQYAPQFEFTLPAALKVGATFTICVGLPLSQKPVKNARANSTQTQVQRRRHCLLYIDSTGTGNYGDPEIFTMDIRGNKLTTIRIITPSSAIRNKRFDIIIRFEDKFGNLTGNAPENTLIELYYDQLRENLNWKLFVPETGFLTLPNFYFNEPGIYKLHLKNLHTGDIYTSSPIKCFLKDTKYLLWGLLHGESERIDSQDNIENCLRHLRDEKALNFFATSCFESIEETPNENWKQIVQNVTEFNEADRFTTFLGFQWQGDTPSEGLRFILYQKDSKSILRKKEAKTNSLKKIYKYCTPKDILSIPSFTMGKGSEFDFSQFNPEFEKVVEIYNAWGSSECTAKEGNPMPIQKNGKIGVNECAAGSIIKALKNNHRFGFVAGGLDDRGTFNDFFDGDQEQYSPGLTAILAEEHSRESLFDALQHRSCYATTGERIVLGFSIAGMEMGKELSTKSKPGLVVNRHIAGYVAATAAIESLEIIRNGDVIKTFNPKDTDFEFTYDDLEPLQNIVLNAKDGNPPFIFYYIRITQEDGHMAWSSPIWIDWIQPAKGNGKPAPPFNEKIKKTT